MVVPLRRGKVRSLLVERAGAFEKRRSFKLDNPQSFPASARHEEADQPARERTSDSQPKI